MNEVNIMCQCGTPTEMQFYHIAELNCVECGAKFNVEMS